MCRNSDNCKHWNKDKIGRQHFKETVIGGDHSFAENNDFINNPKWKALE